VDLFAETPLKRAQESRQIDITRGAAIAGLEIRIERCEFCIASMGQGAENPLIGEAPNQINLWCYPERR
jgi:hypothetical protein